jgi:hypothetical protein
VAVRFWEGKKGYVMDDEQGRSLVSFPYLADATEGTDIGTVIKKTGRAIGLVSRPRKRHSDEWTLHT